MQNNEVSDSIDGRVAQRQSNQLLDGRDLAMRLYEPAFDCDFFLYYYELDENSGFKIFYDRSKITAALAANIFKKKLGDLKEKSLPSDNRKINFNVYATVHGARNSYFIVSVSSIKDETIKFTKGFVEGYIAMISSR